ncbi:MULTISPECIES: hypothetical protein [Streptomyces]|uniref:hypothetical protein n=1 Tax=Streptomyces TaxID=1883 RepID=UPI002248EF80|nr:hypothetical protein [Streptomyces sp. JHD 1]MCX2968841.1 hypothetical protein [Streptomyces sp. JHD 1]
MQSPSPVLPGRQRERFRFALRQLDARGDRPALWLGGTALGYVLLQLVLVVPGLGLGWDETVYVSQVDPDRPAAYLSAPRARGVSYLVAPVLALTDAQPALRLYLAALSGLALFLALWVWRRLLPPPVLALAGALFATVWITLFYGPQVMPNLWVAFATLAAVGCFLRVADDPGERGALAGLALALAAAALLRPPDAAWLALALGAAALAVPGWRRPPLLAAVVLGPLAGVAPWVAEAHAAYGGLFARLERASEIQGGMGWHLAFDDQLVAQAGRSLCRPCTVGWEHPVTGLWWLALPVAVALGVVAVWRVRGVRRRRRTPVVLATATGLTLAVPYLLLIDYAAPRFLLPAYALLMLPVAFGLVRLACGGRRGVRPVVAGALALVLAGHLAVQAGVAHGAAARSGAAGEAVAAVAAELNRAGVRPPCVVSGHDAVRVAYRAGCASRQPAGHDESITAAGLRALAERRPVAVLVADGGEPPRHARGWRAVPLPSWSSSPSYVAYVSPSAR